jgi:hypothetical protein
MTWTIDGCLSMQNLDIVRGDNRIAMIDCENEALSDSDILTNARLIAAAPDLLAALTDASAYIEKCSYIDRAKWLAVRATIDEAIAKAKGN